MNEGVSYQGGGLYHYRTWEGWPYDLDVPLFMPPGLSSLRLIQRSQA